MVYCLNKKYSSSSDKYLALDIKFQIMILESISIEYLFCLFSYSAYNQTTNSCCPQNHFRSIPVSEFILKLIYFGMLLKFSI